MKSHYERPGYKLAIDNSIKISRMMIISRHSLMLHYADDAIIDAQGDYIDRT
jgi:hypothetical protein